MNHVSVQLESEKAFSSFLKKLKSVLFCVVFNYADVYLSASSNNDSASEFTQAIKSAILRGETPIVNMLFSSSLGEEPCTPTLQIARQNFKPYRHHMKIDALCCISLCENYKKIFEAMCLALSNLLDQYLLAFEFHYGHSQRYPRSLSIHSYRINDYLFLVFYPSSMDEQKELEWRKEMHNSLSLPLDRPLFRRGQALHPVPRLVQWLGPNEETLVCPHEYLKPPPGSGTTYIIQGRYTYKHYLQDSVDDKNWGCAYRSLQTLISWLMWQGEVLPRRLPSIVDIQSSLVRAGDKPKSFIGSRQWIGSLEVSEKLIQLAPSAEHFTQLLSEHWTALDYGISDDFVNLLSRYTSRDVSPSEFDKLSRHLLEYTWEKLHSGHWKTVSDSWRVAYACVRVLRGLYKLVRDNAISENELLKEVIKEFDYSLLLGFPIFDGIATQLASVAHQELAALESRNGNCGMSEKNYFQSGLITIDQFDVGDRPLVALDRIDRPSLEKFLQLLHAGRPFILTGAMHFWPACLPDNKLHWSVNSWRARVGHRLVPIEIGSRYTDDSWGQELMTVGEFIDRFVQPAKATADVSKQVGYLAQHQLFLQIPELGEDVHTPDYCLVGGESTSTEATVDSNVWFGPAGTVSPLHHDSDRANLLAQVNGCKYVILYCASETNLLYPHPEHMLCNTSRVDAEHPDLEEFPKFSQAHGFHGILYPGEMLYIPPRCWHYIRAISTSFSVNFWWNVCPKFIPAWPE